MHSWFVAAALVGVALGPFAQADAALSTYLRVQRSAGGLDLKTDAKGKKPGDAWPIVALDHQVSSPRDAASGLATGRRQHRPMVLTMELGKATPQLFKIMAADELLPEVELSSFAPGGKVPLYTVKLINASITSIHLPGSDRIEVSFTYQKIRWTWTETGEVWDDDWLAPTVAPPAPKPLPAKK